MFRLLPFGGDQRFNPRTRTGCDRARLEAQPEIVRVSTHAPARGATSVRVRLPRAFQVSTHAPARGATQIVAGHPFRFLFQPTHPHGVRRRLCTLPLNPCLVSTHAPARGATSKDSEGARRIIVSTHAPARGATRFFGYSAQNSSSFNPRTRTGCDTHQKAAPAFCLCFNPRTRTGCDPA